MGRGCARGCAKGGRGVVERKSRRDALRIDEGENGEHGNGERECTKRGWVEGIISPMQIAFGLRLTEYTLELARCEFRPPYFPRENGRASVCAHAILKNSIIENRSSLRRHSRDKVFA